MTASPRAQRRSSVSANATVSAANVLAVVGASLVAVPLIIDHLGVAGYGLWTLGQSLVIYVTTADSGFGPALSRLVSLRARDRHELRPIVWLAVLLYALAGALLVLVAHFAASWLVGLFHVPSRFHADAVHMTRLLGWVALAALVSSALGYVLIGLERFHTYTVSTALGSLGFLSGLSVLLSGSARLADVAYAALLQWSLVTAMRVVALQSYLVSGRPQFPKRTDVRELLGFSARLQAATLATLLNTQTDRVVVGAVSSARTLGQVSVATQVAEAARYLAQSVLSPLITRMALVFGHEGRPPLDDLYRGIVLPWRVITAGSTVILAAAMPALIRAWLGAGHGQAAAFAVVLVVAYGCSLLGGPAIAYLRAIGRPGLEGLYGTVTVVANLAFTIVLGILFGASGVIAATLVAYVLSTGWFLRRVSEDLPTTERPSAPQMARWGVAAAVAAATALGLGEASTALLPTGVALVGVGAGALGAFLAFVAAGSGVVLTPARIRNALFDADTVESGA